MPPSPNQTPPAGPIPGSKKRRLQGACDICRHKKIKCDSALMPGNRCTHCIAFNSECTHTLSGSKKRNDSSKSYVEDLEQRVKKLEQMLSKLDPNSSDVKDYESLFTQDEPPPEGVMFSCGGGSLSSPSYEPDPSASSSPRALSNESSHGSPAVLNDAPEKDEVELANELKRLYILPGDARFFGKSSSFVLLHTAMGVKQEYIESKPLKPSEFKRPEFWELPKYEHDVIASHQVVDYEFPEPDLLKDLVDLYFTTINLIIPLLHRPTFEAQIDDSLHLRDQWFGAVLLAVCALASRYSDDPRVLLDGSDSWHSCGWKWFSQIRAIRQSFIESPSLYELQFYSLAVLYYQGSSNPQACWVMVGLGLRYAQEVGAHRKKVKIGKLTVQDELWKRAFWMLIVMDKIVSAFVGRPCAIHEEDYDVDYPLEVDDEYWENSSAELSFKQPQDKISTITAFNLILKLCEILAVALRALYSANKSKLWTGMMGPQWEHRIVAELDSQLNSWLDSVPEPLRWNSRCEDPNIYALSANLYCTYYYIQILVHRPFISGSLKTSALSFPSLAICVNAARSCSHLLDAYVQRSTIPPAPTCQMAAFTSGLVLLINIWGAKKSRISFNPEKEMADVYKLMHVIKLYETRWRVAGRLWDMLNGLASAEDLPTPEYNPRSNKRPQPVDDNPSSSSIGLSMAAQKVNGPDVMSGSESQRVDLQSSTSSDIVGQAREDIQQPQYTNLPLTTDELGRLPVYNDSDTRPFPHWSAINLGPFFGQNLSPVSSSSSMQHQMTSVSYPQMDSSFSQYSGVAPSSGIQQAYQVFPDNTSLLATTNTSSEQGGNAMDLWSSVPSGFDLDEWGGYLASFDTDVFS